MTLTSQIDFIGFKKVAHIHPLYLLLYINAEPEYIELSVIWATLHCVFLFNIKHSSFSVLPRKYRQNIYIYVTHMFNDRAYLPSSIALYQCYLVSSVKIKVTQMSNDRSHLPNNTARNQCFPVSSDKTYFMWATSVLIHRLS